MNSYECLRDSLGAGLAQIVARFVEYLPSVLGALLLLLAGWMVAHLVRGAAVLGMGILELVLHRVFRGRGAGATPNTNTTAAGPVSAR